MQKNKLILFQGDSITDGNRLKNFESDLNHQMGHGYASVVNSTLGAKYPEKNLRFLNRGISGNRIAELYGRWKEDTLCLKPDVLSILIGINDCEFLRFFGTGSDAGRFEKIYRLLLDEAREENPDISFVLMEPFSLPVGERKDNFDEVMSCLKPYQQAVRTVAEDYGAVFLPLQDKFFELADKYTPDYWIWDGIHPTVCGHQIIAEEWMKKCSHLLIQG